MMSPFPCTVRELTKNSAATRPAGPIRLERIYLRFTVVLGGMGILLNSAPGRPEGQAEGVSMFPAAANDGSEDGNAVAPEPVR
jgi:hypothetical protein